MSRRKRPPPIKRRTREHIIADLGVNHVERQVLRCGWTVEPIRHDYGLDLFMRTFAASGEPEPGGVFFQVKATDAPDFLRDGSAVRSIARLQEIVETPMPRITLYEQDED